jgi:hypothetical protein
MVGLRWDEYPFRSNIFRGREMTTRIQRIVRFVCVSLLTVSAPGQGYMRPHGAVVIGFHPGFLDERKRKKSEKVIAKNSLLTSSPVSLLCSQQTRHASALTRKRNLGGFFISLRERAAT